MSIPARSLILIAALLPSARATSITLLPATTIAQATTERNTWLTETFGTGTTPNPIQADIDKVNPERSETTILQLLTSFHSLYFFMTGVDANLQIRTADGTKAYVHSDDSDVYFVGITSSNALGSIQWRSSDSFRLIDFGVPQKPAQAPEPATALAAATGLVLMMLLLSTRSAWPPTQQPKLRLPRTSRK